MNERTIIVISVISVPAIFLLLIYGIVIMKTVDENPIKTTDASSKGINHNSAIEAQVNSIDTVNLEQNSTLVTWSKEPHAETFRLKNNIAFLEPTFTEAAYTHAFYDFYHKYASISRQTKITTDLDKLTAHLDKLTSSYVVNTSRANMTIFSNVVKKILPNATLTNIKDQDVEEGQLFLNNGGNAFDILILLHEEYVTQKMYDDFKRFVSNGGTILFVDSDFYHAEVNYDKNERTVTLILGHGFKFDGKVAEKSINERWFDETRQWTGGNFWTPSGGNVVYTNNIFNYTHHEEEYASNPRDIIILDYGALDPLDREQHTVATYKMHFDKGEVIVIGLYGQDISKNEKFLNFFGNLLLK